MIIVSYDISNDKVRAQFSKFLLEYGDRLQYSVYQIQNSNRVLNLITAEIENNFSKRFCNADSVLIFRFHERELIRYGHATHRTMSLVSL